MLCEDSQKHELVGRALRALSESKWDELFENIVENRFKERSICFRELSGRETFLQLQPTDRHHKKNKKKEHIVNVLYNYII